MAVAVKFKNVSVKFGKKFRHNQNYTMVFWKLHDGVGPDTTVEDIKSICETHYSNRMYFNDGSQIEIVHNTYKPKIENA